MNSTLHWQPLSPALPPDEKQTSQDQNALLGSAEPSFAAPGAVQMATQPLTQQGFENEPAPAKFQWKKPAAWAFAATLLQFGLFSAFSGSSASNQPAERVAILVATQKLERGATVTSSHFKSVEVKASEAVAALVKFEDFEKYKGRKLAVGISANNALPKAALFSDFQERSAPEHIPPGKRLLKLQASLGDLANVIKPGDRVDVIAIMDLPQVGKITETLLEAQDVVGVGNILLDDKNSARQGDELAFFVTPEQFKLLTYAQNFARFSIALRNPNDVAQSTGATAMTLNKFLANPRIQNAVNSDYFKIRKGNSDAGQ